MSDNRYINNRNLWRRVAAPPGTPRRPPIIVTESTIGSDGITRTVQLDQQKTIRHRDVYEIRRDPPPVTLGEYDEDLIHFNNETLKVFSYNFTFSSDPTVVFSEGIADPAQPNTENINIFGISRNTTGGVVALSAPYSGTIRYRAAYAPSYPSYFTGSIASIAPTAGIFIASVDRKVPDNESYITSSWAPLASVTPNIFQSPYDDNSNFDADVALAGTFATLTNSGEVIEISAPMSSSIYVLAVQ